MAIRVQWHDHHVWRAISGNGSIQGDLLKDSGWTGAPVEAEIATAGTADSFISASHVKKACLAHQVTTCSLFKLQKDAYIAYSKDAEETNELSFEESPQFYFWNPVLELEILVFVFIRSYRELSFLLYKDMLQELIPFFFALDHVHYSRWLSIHLRDMEELNSSTFTEFAKGNFTIQKTARPFFFNGYRPGPMSKNNEGGLLHCLKLVSSLRSLKLKMKHGAKSVRRHHDDTFKVYSHYTEMDLHVTIP